MLLLSKNIYAYKMLKNYSSNLLLNHTKFTGNSLILIHYFLRNAREITFWVYIQPSSPLLLEKSPRHLRFKEIGCFSFENSTNVRLGVANFWVSQNPSQSTKMRLENFLNIYEYIWNPNIYETFCVNRKKGLLKKTRYSL